MNEITSFWDILGKPGILLVAAIVVGVLIQIIIFKVGSLFSKRTKTSLDDLVLKYMRGPIRVLIPLLLVNLTLPVIESSTSVIVRKVLDKSISIVLVIGIAWLLIRIARILQEFLLSQYQLDVKDNLKARKIYTQIDVMNKIITVIIITLALAAVLMNFQKFRELGTGILASAGIAGIIIGFAAQKTLSNLLAGIQIAITQPIRIDDVVVVENEWGRIEEITLTYVVVRIWDLRRLILPISYFLEKPFQNWTRTSASILGTVFLYVDYTVPIDAIREELHRILDTSKLWNKEVWGLQTTNTDERTVELRALMSAPDSSTAWDLRCEVREKLIDFVQKNYPDALPKLRAEMNQSTIREASDSQSLADDRKNG